MRRNLRALTRGRGAYLLAAADQVGLSAFSFLLSFTAIRLLSAGDLGLYSLWGEICVFATGLQSALVLMPLTVHVPAAEAAERPFLLRGLGLVNAAYCGATVAAVAAALILSRADWVPRDVGTRVAACLVVAGVLLREYPRQAAFGAGRVPAATLMDGVYLAAAGGTLGILLLTLPAAWPARLLFALIAAIAAGAAAAGLVGLALMRRRGVAPKKTAGLRAYVRVLPEVRWAAAGGLATTLQDRTYIMLLTAISGLEAVGAVFAGGFLLRISSILSTAWSRVARPQMARFVAVRDLGGLDRTLWTGVGALLAQHLALCLAVVLLWRWIAPLLSRGRYVGLYEVALCWIAATTFAQFRAALSVALQAAKDFRFLALTTALAAAITLPTTLVAILVFGWRTSVLGLAAGEAAAGGAILLRWLRIRTRLRAPVAASDEASGIRRVAAG